jgi:diguanylate cyclase (GGDEF)-like protein/PAS domain S-box-containing protein
MNPNFDETRFCDSLGCLVIRLDRQLNIGFMNRRALNSLAYENPEQIVGRPLQSVLPADDPKSAELLASLRHLAPTDPPLQAESDVQRNDGSRFPVSWSISQHVQHAQHGEAEQATSTILLGFNAGAMPASQAGAVMFQTVADNFTGSLIITDPQRNILYVNSALLGMTGHTADEVIGRTPSLFRSGHTSEDIYRSLWETVNAGRIWQGEFINCRKDGSQYLESKTIAAIRDAYGLIQYYFAIGEDVSTRQHSQKLIETLLAFDQLTGLPNHEAFQHALVGAIDSARQETRELTVLHIDIDDFAVINDAVGTGEADLVIVEIAIRIREALRQDDRLARLGSDKFAVLLGPHEPGIDDDIRDVAGRLLAAIGQTALPEAVPASLSASIGIVGFPTDGASASELLSHALSATKQVKAAGGNAFGRFSPAAASTISARRETLHDLKKAIDRNELILHFQPQVNLFSGAIVGMEALIRWQHPQRGLVFPSDFIPLAEQSSHIVEIGEWVLGEACRQIKAWTNAGLPAIKVAVNLSARHFIVPGLHVTIADILRNQGVDPRFLEIEITEGAMMQDVAAAIRSTNLLKDVGVRLSLDDFGTGYSSLAYLSRFPIDVVKIDQSFIADITSNPANAAIAQATIAMSHKLGKIVLAEGVETEEQMQFLRRNECDEMQGYFFARPLPAADITRMLHDGATMNVSGQRADGNRSTVLLVDDEANILASLKRTLRREGYDILTATSAAEGFSLLAKNSVQVIVSDQRMPEMNGTEFLSRVKNLYPETVRMVLSGYSEISAVTDSINKGAVYRFMLKPWDDERLKEEISGALRHWREMYAPPGDS